MLRGSLLLVLLLCTGCALATSVWPQPYSAKYGTTKIQIEPSMFTVKTTSSSQLLARAISRYTSSLLFPFSKSAAAKAAVPFVTTISVLSDSELLDLSTDDSYNVTVVSGSVTIIAPTVFGAMHGLETLSQLIEYDALTMTYSIYASTTIVDKARFPWRGMLIDTARHYLKMETLYRMIDTLSYNKMNVLHWHTVDAQSFPIKSNSYPLLETAAWFPTAVYSPSDVSAIVSYAKDRGVRVIPEFDVPGHAYSWGVGYPELTVSCPRYESNINNIPLDPTLDFTYEVIDGLFSDMSQIFPDEYFHIGGDEVVFGCWETNANVSAWMKAMGFTSLQTEDYFCKKVEAILAKLDKTPMVWQEIFEDGITIPSNAVVEAWMDKGTLGSIINAGYRGLLAAGWYLDRQIPAIDGATHYEWEDTWKDFYVNEPTNGIGSVPAEKLSNILGGEACMWGEQVHESNIESRIWPRASAVAERLWSQSSVSDTSAALPRLATFSCRMVQRGIRAGPVTPDYCPTP